MQHPQWPPLPLPQWRDTRDTLQMWMQIAGKICLALTPRVNHFWNITFQITSRGLTTPALTYQDRTFTLTFDFIAHEVVLQLSDGTRETIPMRPQTVADFYAAMMAMLKRAGIEVRIWTMPVEVPNPIRFEQDTMHRSYDADAARRCWEVLLAIKPVLESFRAEFIGKCSPVHFFWGGFDVAVTRFSGRRAPERPGADAMTRESYSHEVISHGWWPGGGAIDEPAFYAYAAPEPEGFKTARVEPAAAFYSSDLSEFLLPYEAVRTAPNPEADLRAFLRTTYDAAAERARWDRQNLERTARI
ncbi:MAG TPA: DUF5996 family protein [Vicinamibacterales bacterium]|nr:DUF5996 family protein [Vicinamibacterales bacterium]